MQPAGGLMGYQGPDQGYALRLCRTFRDRIALTPGEDLHDVERGCVQIALKRASLFGRAPVVHDLEIAYRVWGFLDEEAPSELVAARRHAFEGVAERHHYSDARRLVGSVSSEVLRCTPDEIARRHAQDWESLLDLS